MLPFAEMNMFDFEKFCFLQGIYHYWNADFFSGGLRQMEACVFLDI